MPSVGGATLLGVATGARKDLRVGMDLDSSPMVRGLDKVLSKFKGLDDEAKKSFGGAEQSSDQLAQKLERDSQAAAKLKETLGEKFDPQAFDAYNRALDNTRAKLEREKGYRVVLGADFDKRAFQASERELVKIKRQTESVRVEHNRLGPAIAGAFSGSERHVEAFSNALGGGEGSSGRS